MPTYRAFFFDAQRHIMDCREFDAGDHDAALDTARQWTNGMLIEVWKGGEMVGTLRPGPKDIGRATYGARPDNA